MADAPRKPPRFVPTLTTVLEPPSEAAAPRPVADATPVAAVQAVAPPAIEASQAIALDPQARFSEAQAFKFEGELLHRVLQSVDLSLEERLSDAVSAAIQQQLDAMIPRLRAEIEVALRALVSEALARELSDDTGSMPAFRPQSLG